jgi:hypothetical protein
MERLTKYLASGAADYNYPAGCYSGNDCNDRVAKSAYRQTCVERLAAYEETGLTPEESKRMSNILMDVGIDYNCSWEYVKNWLLDDRLRELDEADKDGRLVVLPCKVGDTVYMIERIFDIDNGVCDEICARKVIGYGGNNLNKLWLIGSGGICNVSIFVSEFGKTVFLTREEAEKALEAMK